MNSAALFFARRSRFHLGWTGLSKPVAMTVLVLASAARAQDFTATDRQPTQAELAKMHPIASAAKAEALMKDVRAPADFDVTIYATSPAVNYPVFVSAAADGTLFISSDGNGSLDRKPHLGRVLRVRDTNGDGRADEVKAFVPDVDSPRGLVFDHDRVYLLHPPDISVYIDHDGDGIADEEKTLVKGIAFGFKDRPADHSSNGLELGIDGWLYAAIGDFGFMEAVGTDGRKLQFRGGGVIRVRPDGSNLEVYAHGTRNILEAAVSPLLDIFARDNTNDGGGWDVRFHHFSGLTEHGYPSLFKNFPGEFIEPLADYGGGSGCGAAWIGEPGIPAKWNNGPMTCDWGRDWVYHHTVAPKGATFTATQEEFLGLPRVTDLDIDGNSAIYALSWKGATFTWEGPNVGFVVKATPKGFTPEPLPDFEKLTDAELVAQLENSSNRRRLEAQRTLLRRTTSEATVKGLTKLAKQKSQPMASRVAALFTLKQLPGEKANPQIIGMLGDETLRPWVLRAMTDRADQMEGVTSSPIAKTLKSPDARTRREGAVALARLGDARAAISLIPLLADSDAVVVHSSIRALSTLKASTECFELIDEAKPSTEQRKNAFLVLQSIHEKSVVDGLIARLNTELSPARREGIITTLCRLHFTDGVWKGDSWGTRPDTRGPYYQPETWAETPTISKALKDQMARTDAAEIAFIGRELARNRIPAGDALDKLISQAATNPALLPVIAAQLAQAESIPANAVAVLVQAATAEKISDAARAQSVIALVKSDSGEAWSGAVRGMPKVQATSTENNLAERARDAFFNSPKLDLVHASLAVEAARLDGSASEWADAALLRLAGRKVGAPEARAAAAKALDEGWSQPARKIQIMKAAAMNRDTSRAAAFVAALDDQDAKVAATAKETVSRLHIDIAKIRAASQSAHVGDMSADAVIAKMSELKGDAKRGEQLFTQVGCVSCHTVKASEPVKGPYLGTIANVYRRPALAEAILIPNKTIAQGFATHHFEMKDGREIDGFVVREASDEVTIRDVTAQEQKIIIKDVVKREKLERSLMPEGLAAGLTLDEFASLLDYLQALATPTK